MMFKNRVPPCVMFKSRVKLAIWSRYLCFVSLLTLVLGFIHQRHFNYPTAVSRLDLLHALIQHRTLRIDDYQKNTPDKSWYAHHFYSDKAPGTAVLALPGFAVSAGLMKLTGVPLDSDAGWLTSSWVASVTSNGVIAALGAVALYCWLLNYVPSKWALITVIALFLGAAPLPYATMMFSHALVVGLLGIAVWAIEGKEKADGLSSAATFRAMHNFDRVARASNLAAGNRKFVRIGKWLFVNGGNLLAGHACGWALASEYTAGIVVVGLFFLTASIGWRPVIVFCLGAVPPLLLIPAYGYACFGSPFVLSYSLSESFPAMREGLYAIKWPDAGTAIRLLISPTRGLFFWSPFLLMAGLGYCKLIRTNSRLFWFTYAVPLLQIVIISGRTWDWQAGATLGPRYLAPILPLLALPCALGVTRAPLLGVALGAYSIVITTLATLTRTSRPR